MGPILNVTPYSDYKVLIELSNGHTVIMDFKKKLNTIRFSELGNVDVFRKVITDGYSLMWKNGKIRVSFAELIELLQNTSLLYRAV